MARAGHFEGSLLKNPNSRTIITAALPYANADLHIGHIASTYLPPDILYRYLKMKRKKVVQVCASDDFGTPILIAAERSGKRPEDYVAAWNRSFREDLERLGMVYDLFDRTSSPENVKLVQAFFGKLNENGFIFSSDVSQFYCENDRKFLPDRYVKGKCPYCGTEEQYSDGCENCGRTFQPGQILNPHCALCGRPPVTKKSTHYFFKLSAFSERLKEWLTVDANLQSDAKNYVLNWIKEGLQDWDITRDMEWGVPIPLKDAKGKVLYGWFDNHLCYITMALKIAGGEGIEGADFWNESTICHFIGKDIVYHHYLFLPSMRMGEGTYKLPDFIPTRGHLLIQGKKMSKSRRWMVTVKDFLRLFPPDYLRFYLTRIVPYSQADSDFVWNEFRDKINNELVANLGNFANRAISFVANKFGGVVPRPDELGDDDKAVLAGLSDAAGRVGSLIEGGQYDRALKAALDFSDKCNQYFQHREPWKEGEGERTTIFCACTLTAGLAVMMNPFLPFSSEALWQQLGLKGTAAQAGWEAAARPDIKAGARIGRAEPLFKRVEESDLKAAEALLG